MYSTDHGFSSFTASFQCWVSHTCGHSDGVGDDLARLLGGVSTIAAHVESSVSLVLRGHN